MESLSFSFYQFDECISTRVPVTENDKEKWNLYKGCAFSGESEYCLMCQEIYPDFYSFVEADTFKFYEAC
jgi:hypothetical protein